MNNKPNTIPESLPQLQSTPRQMHLTFDTVELQEMNPEQRAGAIKRLAALLIPAACIAMEKECADDER